jgi:hypothetical protein
LITAAGVEIAIWFHNQGPDISSYVACCQSDLSADEWIRIHTIDIEHQVMQVVHLNDKQSAIITKNKKIMCVK